MTKNKLRFIDALPGKVKLTGLSEVWVAKIYASVSVTWSGWGLIPYKRCGRWKTPSKAAAFPANVSNKTVLTADEDWATSSFCRADRSRVHDTTAGFKQITNRRTPRSRCWLVSPHYPPSLCCLIRKKISLLLQLFLSQCTSSMNISSSISTSF